MQHQIFERNGCLAVAWSESVLQDRPARIAWCKQSTIRADRYPELVGKMIESGGDQVYIGHGNWVRIGFDWVNWPQESHETPITPPRDGKTHTWVWRSGSWQKEEWPRCELCPWGGIGGYHKPGLPYCQECGHCHAKRCRERSCACLTPVLAEVIP